ncbi:MAG TPA: serine/threonine-protein kinase, partial [Aggregatilineales bacterium]|nr:serine/threonine-protein kinase [Aggregatilineales bacterium]
MSDLLLGKKLGDYQIQRLLGKGGMARVYVGFDERLQRHAAVKVINSDLMVADKGEYAERFRREARAIARLNHPNIVGVYQFGDYETLYYMAMAFIEGRDLRQILRENSDRGTRMPYRDILNIVQGIGAALDYAHSRGVIHRDIKPSNIMLDADNRPVLTDFGLALAQWEGTLGDTFGTAHYIAPEQAVSSAKAVPQSDLYSLGICTYEMLTGKVPFDDPSAMSVALKHLNDAPPPLRTYVPDIPPAVEGVILKAIEKDAARRFANGVEMADALAVAMAHHITDSRPSRRSVLFNDLKLSESQMRRLGILSPTSASNAPTSGASAPRPPIPMEGYSSNAPTSEVKAAKTDAPSLRRETLPVASAGAKRSRRPLILAALLLVGLLAGGLFVFLNRGGTDSPIPTAVAGLGGTGTPTTPEGTAESTPNPTGEGTIAVIVETPPTSATADVATEISTQATGEATGTAAATTKPTQESTNQATEVVTGSAPTVDTALVTVVTNVPTNRASPTATQTITQT